VIKSKSELGLENKGSSLVIRESVLMCARVRVRQSQESGKEAATSADYDNPFGRFLAQLDVKTWGLLSAGVSPTQPNPPWPK
jgi:hypothetical protein